MTLEEAVNFAAEKLPDGWIVRIDVESGAAWVTLFNGNGDWIKFEDSDRTLAEQVVVATETARSIRDDEG